MSIKIIITLTRYDKFFIDQLFDVNVDLGVCFKVNSYCSIFSLSFQLLNFIYIEGEVKGSIWENMNYLGDIRSEFCIVKIRFVIPVNVNIGWIGTSHFDSKISF